MSRGLTNKQSAILKHLIKHPQGQSLDQILINVPEARTAYGSKGYLSETLKRLMRRAVVVRVARGVYAVHPAVQICVDPVTGAVTVASD